MILTMYIKSVFAAFQLDLHLYAPYVRQISI